MGTIALKNARKAFGDAVIIPNASLDIRMASSSFSSAPRVAASPRCCA